MSRTHRLLSHLLLVAWAACRPEAKELPPSVVRPQKTAADAFVECAAHLYRLPAFVSYNNPLPTIGACPESKAQLVEELRKQKIRLVETSTSVVAVPEWCFANEPPLNQRYRWKSAVVETEVEDFGPKEKLTAEEKELVVGAILRWARTPPVSFDFGPGDAAGTVTTKLMLAVGARALQPGARSAFALWGYPNGWRRLIYGVLVNGRFELKWDSPVLCGNRPALRFEDVDGDGVEEIAALSTFGRHDMMMSVFSVKGEELTRQPTCVTCWGWDEEHGVACPIVAEDVSFEDGVGGHKDIVAEGSGEGLYRLRLEGGRYKRVEEPR